MKGYRVDFTLSGVMVVPDNPIHFDALLAWASVEQGMQEGISMEEAHERLPLAREEQGGAWAWKASQLTIQARKNGFMTTSRRMDPTEIVNALDEGRFVGLERSDSWAGKTGTGVYKSYLLKHPLQWAEQAQAWFVGDKDKVAALLADVTNLGKLARLGMGKITQITITEDDAALERWQWRNLPWHKDGFRKAMVCCRPPYWKRENAQVGWVPPA